MASLGKKDDYSTFARMEIASIDSELKDWFLSRRVSLERNLVLKKELDAKNFSGLSKTAHGLPAAEKTLWKDLTSGKPSLDPELSKNARVMKADMYLSMFRQSTDLEHVCRLPGSSFLRCLKENSAASGKSGSTSECEKGFQIFDQCRKGVQIAEKEGLERAVMKQDIQDQRAKAMFERRNVLLDTLAC